MTLEVPLDVDSHVWLQKTLCSASGNSSLRDFQDHLGYEIAVRNQDVFLSVATGKGKSLVLFSGLIASKARGEEAAGILIVPTKALAEQHADTARKYGIRSIVINEDTVRPRDGPDPLQALEQGDDVRVAVVSPQMAVYGLRKLLMKPKFVAKLRWLLIDEAHLVMGDTVFRSHYELLCNLRAVLRRETVWAAVSGSVPTALRPSITRNLGFLPGYYVDASYSQDLPHVKYITRFLSHSTTQGTFHDLSWLIPPTAKALADIPQAIVFVDTITQDGLQLERYLDGLLDRCLPHDEARKVAVRQYNSILTPAERTQWAEDFNNGSIRIGIVTESFIYGLDLDINTGISLGLVKNKTVLKQRRGRVGRRRPGKFILYSPRWVSTAEDTSPLTTAKAKENFERRHQMDPDILAYCNPTLERCSRAVDLDIYGDTWPPDKPWSECSCETHQPGDNATHDAIVQQWLDLFRNDEPKRTAVRSDGTYKPIKSSLLKKKLVELITSWRLTTWYKISPESHIPAPFFLPTSIIQKLVDKAHVCGADYDAFATIASDWRYLPQHGQLLFNFLHHAMEQIDDLWSEVVNSAEFQEVEEIDSESDSSSSDHSGSSQPLSIPRTDSSTSSSDASLVSTASTTSPPPSPPSTAPLDPTPIARLPLALIQPPGPLPARLSDGSTSSQENSIPKGYHPSRTSSKRRSPSRSPVAAQKKRRIQKK